MTTPPSIDLQAAHRFFAAHCFNAAWELMEESERTPEDDRAMEALCQASIYHWAQRDDCAPQNLSVGYWQASRVAALLGRPAEARRHAEACRAYAEGLAPFYLGYAYEALARAARLDGNLRTAEEHLATARGYAALVTDPSERVLLEGDLERP